MASTVVTRKSPMPGRAASRADTASISQVLAVPAREGPSSISCRAMPSRAERRNAGQPAYQESTLSSMPFHSCGNCSTASGRRLDQAWSSNTRRISSSAAAPPMVSSRSVVTAAAAKERRTRSRRRTC